MLDVLVSGGRVVDGSGAAGIPADVGIVGDRVVAVERLNGATAALRIDATGKLVTPGFIDCHSHSDWSLLANRGCESTLLQGVTTEIVGNCGMAHAPVTARNRDRMAAELARTAPGVEIQWATFGEYLDHVAADGVGANYAFLAGHAALRTAVMGADERPAAPEEITQMDRLLARALDEGAIGFSTGLEYVPGRAATTEELIALSRVVGRYDRIHTCHQRTRNERFVDSVREILEVCETAGARLQISHNNKRPGAPDGAWEETMALQEAARQRGVDVACDTTVYRSGIGLMAAVLPPWLFDAGPAMAAERLRDTVIRERVKNDCRRYWLMIADRQWHVVSLGQTNNGREHFGKTFEEIGRLRRRDPMDAYLDVLAAEGDAIGEAGMFGQVKSTEHLRELIQHPDVGLGADAWTASARGPLAPLVNHPASFGWTARVLGEYARAQRWLTMEEAVRKMTSANAARFGLARRGLLRTGYAADLVVFDADTVEDRASFDRPAVSPVGISDVIVNGHPAVSGGRLTGRRAGQVLRR